MRTIQTLTMDRILKRLAGISIALLVFTRTCGAAFTQNSCTSLAPDPTMPTSSLISPITISLDTSQFYVKNQNIKVTLSASSSDIKDFIVQARYIDSGTAAVGSFATDSAVASLTCTASGDTAINAADSTKTSVTLTWTPPETAGGRLYFVASVVDSSNNNFWSYLYISSTVLNPNYVKSYLSLDVKTDIPWSMPYTDEKSTEVTTLINSVDSQLDQQTWPSYVPKVRVLSVSNTGNTVTLNIRADVDKDYPTIWDEAVIGTQVWEWGIQPMLPGSASVTEVKQKTSYATNADGYVTVTGPCSLLDTAQECEKTSRVCTSVSLQPDCVCPPSDPNCNDQSVSSGEGDATRKGTCPKPSSSCNSNVNMCQDDYDCPTAMLCCSNACGGKECVDAVPSPDDVPIRLTNGGLNSGRVEVQYNGEWRTVCAPSNIDEFTVNVMCKQLRFGGAGLSVAPVKDAFAETGSYIWLKSVQCAGSEGHVGDCQNDGWGNVDSCTHDEDVGLFCDVTDDTICFNFVNGQAWNAAYADTTSNEYATITQSLEETIKTAATDTQRTATSVQFNKLSESDEKVKVDTCVTYDKALAAPDQTEAALTLRDNLLNPTGQSSAASVPNTDLQFTYAPDQSINVPLTSDTKVCDIYDATKICQHSGTCIDQNGTPACRCVGNYTGNFCITEEPPEDLTVTLRSPGYAYGVLGVTTQSDKVGVCDTMWNDNNSGVVCRQLGFPSGKRVVLQDMTYATSTKLDYVQCTGTETNVGHCSRPAFKTYTCPDENQVVIYCDDMTDQLTYGFALPDDYDADLGNENSQKFKDAVKKVVDKLASVLAGKGTPAVLSFENNNGKAKAKGRIKYPTAMDPKLQSKEAKNLQTALAGNNDLTPIEMILDHPRNDKTLTMPMDSTIDLCELFRVKKTCVNGANCVVTANDPECTCPTGFTGTDCSEDIDECNTSSQNDCAQICTNTIGSYTCTCRDGYRSINNGRTCDYDNLAVQLADGSAFAGELQISNQDSWGTVCLDKFTALDSDVICRQLGKKPFSFFDAGPILPQNTVPQTIAHLKCTGLEDSIDACPRSVWGDTTCPSGKKVGLLCRDVKKNIPIQLQLDLQWQNSKYTDKNDAEVKQLADDVTKVVKDIMDLFNSTGNSVASFSDVTTGDFQEYGGKVTLNLEAVFGMDIDLEEQAVLGLHLVNKLKDRNNLIARTDSNPDVPVVNTLLVTDTAAGKDMQVSATDAANQCYLLDAKKACLSGGKCVVSGGDAVCNCLATRNDRGGVYCQKVVDPQSPTATNVTTDHLHVLAFRLDLDWLKAYFNESAEETKKLKEKLVKMAASLYATNNFAPLTVIVANLQPGSVETTTTATFQDILTPSRQTQMATAIMNTIADNGAQVPFNGTMTEVLGPLRIVYEGPYTGTVVEVPVMGTCSIYNERELCMRGGSCVSKGNFTPTCVCVSGYSGDFCEYDPNERTQPSTPNTETRRLLIIILCVIGGILLLFVVILGALLWNHKRNRKHESSVSDSDSDTMYSAHSFVGLRPSQGYGFGPMGALGGAYGGTRAGLQTGFMPEYWGVTPGDADYLAAENTAFEEEYDYDTGDMNYPWGRPAVMAGRGITGPGGNILRRHSAAYSERDYF